MTKTLIRDVYLDGFLIPAGTELTAEQAERITNPKATEDLSIPGQDGKPTGDAGDKEPDDSAPPRKAAAPAAKPGR